MWYERYYSYLCSMEKLKGGRSALRVNISGKAKKHILFIQASLTIKGKYLTIEQVVELMINKFILNLDFVKKEISSAHKTVEDLVTAMRTIESTLATREENIKELQFR